MNPCPDGSRRAERCRMLDRLRNPCPNEAISAFGLCAHHLAAAHAEFEAVIAEHEASRR